MSDSAALATSQYPTVQRMSLYPLVSGKDHRNLMTNSVPTLLAISHSIEDAVMKHRLRGTFYAGFQRFSSFSPQINRFSQLAVVCGDVVIFGYPDAPVPVLSGSR